MTFMGGNLYGQWEVFQLRLCRPGSVKFFVLKNTAVIEDKKQD